MTEDQVLLDKFKLLRKKGLGLHVFAGFLPLIFQTRLLSLNSEVAAAHLGEAGLPFSAVVKEVSDMATELSKIVTNVEKYFRGIAHHIASIIRCERYLALHQSALNGLCRSVNKKVHINRAWRHALQPGVVAQWEKEEAGCKRKKEEGVCPKACMESTVWVALKNRRRELICEIAQIAELINKLTSELDDLVLVGVRRSHFLSITAMIEAQRLEYKSAELETASENVVALSKEISDVVMPAHDYVFFLKQLSEEIEKPLKTEINIAFKKVA